MNNKDEGLRYNDGKTRLDPLPADVMVNISEVLTVGAKKYDVNNWARGMAWSKVLASLKRHLAKFEMGIDIDEESGLPHVDLIACNAIFLSRYFRSHPEKDDRFMPFIQNHKRIALDIDGVLADFITPALQRAGVEGRGSASWYPSYSMKKSDVWQGIVEDKDFWMNLKPLVNPEELLFEPTAYVTARSIPVEWTEEWLEANGFPCNPVIAVPADGGEHGSKAQVLDDLQIDIFVDDHYKHFIELNKAGIKCYLMDTYYNARYPVGSFRISHLNEVLKHNVHVPAQLKVKP